MATTNIADRNAAADLTDRPEVEFASLNVVPEEPLSVIPDDTEWDSWDVANPARNNWGLEFIDRTGGLGHHHRLGRRQDRHSRCRPRRGPHRPR